MCKQELIDRLLEYKKNNPKTFAKVINDVQLKQDLLAFPEFSDLPIEQKAAALIIGYLPSCECGNPVEYSGKKKNGVRGTPYGGWADFCSRLCMQKSKSTIEKRKQTNIERHGAPTWAESKKGREVLSEPWSDEKKAKYNASMQATCMTRYNVPHHTMTQWYLDKRNATTLKQTGGKYYNHFQDVARVKAGNLKVYGYDSWAKTPQGRKFHSENNAMKRYDIKLKSRLARMSNRYDKTLLNILISEDKNKFQEYIHNIANPNNLSFRQQIANHLNVSTTYLNALFRKYDMSNEYLSLGTSTSYAEYEICEFLTSIGLSVKSKDRTILEGQEIDLLIESKKLGIEYNGIRYHSENYGGKDKYYHLDKTNLAESKGYQLLHILENEWLDTQKREIWKSIIKAKCGLITDKVYARKCRLSEIDPNVAKSFLNQNHLAGFIGASKHIGLFYNDELVSVLSYGKSRFSKGETEIYRFASKLNMIVVGGLSKMLSVVEGENLVSFADRRFSTINSVYSKIFNNVTIIGPNWYGFDCGTYNLKHRLNFTKQKLKELLGDKYDETKSAVDNMFNNKMDRIFDCGNFKYSFK